MSEAGGGLRMIAIGLAVAAVGLAGVTALVVISRDGSGAGGTPGIDHARPREPALPEARHVAATDLVRLKRDAVAAVLEHGDPIGLRVSDADLRDKLGLGNDDVLVAFSGRPLKRDWDMLDAISGVVMLDAKTVYVELRRAGTPTLVRWQVDGDLKGARRAALDLPTRLPSVAPVADPIVATIARVDDTHLEMPRATADKLTADPVTYTKGVRGYASYGGIEGFRIYAIRPGSVLAAIGIANGDTIRTVNGVKVTSVDQLNEQLAAIGAATAWTLQLERRAAPLTITITVK